eukprot:11384021-Alexandrium_andersonii.AAC.1
MPDQVPGAKLGGVLFGGLLLARVRGALWGARRSLEPRLNFPRGVMRDFLSHAASNCCNASKPHNT